MRAFCLFFAIQNCFLGQNPSGAQAPACWLKHSKSIVRRSITCRHQHEPVSPPPSSPRDRPARPIVMVEVPLISRTLTVAVGSTVGFGAVQESLSLAGGPPTQALVRL